MMAQGQEPVGAGGAAGARRGLGKPEVTPVANELIRPIDEDTARAIQETAKTVGKGIDAVTQGGQYVGRTLGDLPRDLFGIMGDWTFHKRIRRWAGLCDETDRILRARGAENRDQGSPSVAIPLIEAAINEDREVLKDLWAKLLANALDPNRANLVRPSLIELLKQLDPLDALILRQLVTNRAGIPGAPNIELAERLGKNSTQTGTKLICLSNTCTS
jgi:hypothetical protein